MLLLRLVTLYLSNTYKQKLVGHSRKKKSSMNTVNQSYSKINVLWWHNSKSWDIQGGITGLHGHSAQTHFKPQAIILVLFEGSGLAIGGEKDRRSHKAYRELAASFD